MCNIIERARLAIKKEHTMKTLGFPVMPFTFRPADGTTCLMIQVILYLSSFAVTPADGTLILHLNMAPKQEWEHQLLLNLTKTQTNTWCAEKKFLGDIFFYLPPVFSVHTQQPDTQTLLTVAWTYFVSALAARTQNHVRPLSSCLKLSRKCILAAHLPH